MSDRRQKAEGRRQKTAGGFTLVELMLVVIIIAVLASAVVPRLVGQSEKAKTARATGDIAAIGLAIDLYHLDIDDYPEQLEDLTRRDAPTNLSEQQRGMWTGPYLKKATGKPKDPWGRDYEYKKESAHNLDFDLSSAGPDGQSGTVDDVANWKEQ